MNKLFSLPLFLCVCILFLFDYSVRIMTSDEVVRQSQLIAPIYTSYPQDRHGHSSYVQSWLDKRAVPDVIEEEPEPDAVVESIDESSQNGELGELWVDNVRYTLQAVFIVNEQTPFAVLLKTDENNVPETVQLFKGDEIAPYTLTSLHLTSARLLADNNREITLTLFSPQKRDTSDNE